MPFSGDIWSTWLSCSRVNDSVPAPTSGSRQELTGEGGKQKVSEIITH